MAVCFLAQCFFLLMVRRNAKDFVAVDAVAKSSLLGNLSYEVNVAPERTDRYIYRNRSLCLKIGCSAFQI
jgi:hypothetical protein